MTIPGTGGATYVFNAENQMTSTSNSTMSYIYDSDGNRVEKSGSKINRFGGTEILDETDTTGSITNSSFNEYVFFGGMRIARRDSSGNVFYYLADQLGSSRVIAEVPSRQATATLCYDADFELSAANMPTRTLVPSITNSPAKNGTANPVSTILVPGTMRQRRTDL
jgi:hypothetical protein